MTTPQSSLATLLLLLTSGVLACGPAIAPKPPNHEPLPEADKRLEVVLGKPVPGTPDPLLNLLGTEAERMGKELSLRKEGSIHHLAFEVTDLHHLDILCMHGAIVSNNKVRRRLLDVDIRVGTPGLDNTHPREETVYYQGVTELPQEFLPAAIRPALWWETDQAYKKALAEFTHVLAYRNMGMGEDSGVGDFSQEAPTLHIESPAMFSVDRGSWERRLVELGALFRNHEHIHDSFVRLEAHASTRYLASLAGDRVQTSRTHARLSFGASGTTSDGEELSFSEEVDVHDAGALPSNEGIRQRVLRLIEHMGLQSKAPLAEPFVGPAILEAKAAAVFFHEVFGHRVEGHRQKGNREGQTFLDQVGRPIMSSVFNVYDDPTIRSVNGVDLVGHYLVDSEGIGAQRAQLIENGVFVGFLMSRMPIRGVTFSNGHGRRQAGYRALARQANLVVEPTRVTSREHLNRAFIEEIRLQNKPYGFRVHEVKGGYAMTQRGDPQAFLVEPMIVTRVYADGREELVRGVALEGTPLSVLGNVLHAANDFAVFNGYCGAESGEIPASSTSPSLLVRQIEFSRLQSTPQKPPLLPAPLGKSASEVKEP